MPDTTTIARPYAKAIFEYALAVNKLSQWSEILQTLAVSVMNEAAAQFIVNPETTEAQQQELLMTPFAKSGNDELKAIANLVSLLTGNKRLMLLPDIKVQFEALRAEQEKTLVVKVRSFSELTGAQTEQLKKSLSQRLKREVTLKVSIDKSLLGGAVIQAGDLVIDGSVLEQLKRLGIGLAA
ncbi:F0F1 ATP synthase subunit delta [Legionella hackeliae]|uniref:ATP synthase subunit delta n=1 Tax=Legionella hackeliae TaxID=449 RepID=A0A0A8UU22_LEGHA|nr:F0F1 ATP synthase subunit delta [Legionella hackeliae]KTD12784.1 ATP synthase F1 subunit delta [Legionella hackeliae]CEK12208.1 ATP synthase subunit delta [Legionella hackeliae]STX48993.1 ATP synthase F1 subunit delta [Legionella hackeliae]